MIKDLISIIIPSYNHSKFINDLFLSIINIDYEKKNIELIINDDYSSDDTFDKIVTFYNEYRSLFYRVVINKNSFNLGIVKNINEALKKSNGEFIKIIASDDILNKCGLKIMSDYLKNNQDVGFVFSNAYIINELTTFETLQTGYRMLYDINDKIESYNYDDLFIRNYISAPTVMFRTSVFDKYGYFDERFSWEDYPYWLKICDTCSYKYINKATVYYRFVFKNTRYSKTKYSELANTYITLFKENHNKVLDDNKKKSGVDNFLSKAYISAIKSGDNDLKNGVIELIKEFHVSYFNIYKMRLRDYLSNLKKSIYILKSS